MFVLTKIESGVSKSMQPSLVCCSCAAVDSFLPLRFLGFIQNPGILANTSRIVEGLLLDVELVSEHEVAAIHSRVSGGGGGGRGLTIIRGRGLE
ncbi:jg19792 [Pararge aegeria aegeria]|uniref:Jg19792 protein n=1 Tax=Pararge aegeria aegeria TaxID=348720 RepID=A0A8S4SKM1_9NEOP|nr:jg19792 [Pararge aegeria aegeria]